MKHSLVFLLTGFLFLAISVFAGENLLVNGKLDCEQGIFPDNWGPRDVTQFQYFRTGGHDDGAYVVIEGNGKSPNLEVSARQSGLELVAGETYRLSAWVRCKGNRGRLTGVRLINENWSASSGFGPLPVDTNGKWIHLEKEILAPPPPKRNPGSKSYAVVFVSVAPVGRIEIADICLEAVSEKAKANSVNKGNTAGKIMPYTVEPLLYRIPADKPRILFGATAGKRWQLILQATVAGKTFRVKRNEKGLFPLNLQGIAPGEYSMTVQMLDAAKGNAKLTECTMPIRIASLPACPSAARVRRLNEQVMELASITKPASEGSVTFAALRNGWVYISGDFQFSCDNGPWYKAPHMLNLMQGEHKLVFKEKKGALAIRQIPMLGSSGLPAASLVIDPQQTMERFLRNALPNSNFLVTGRIDEKAWKDAGLERACPVGVADMNARPDAAALQARIDKCPAMKPDSKFNGITLDEYSFGWPPAAFQAAAEVLRKHSLTERNFDFALTGKPTSAVHAELISALRNAGKGRGRLLMEIYCQQQPTEKMAAAFLARKLDLSCFDAIFPNTRNSIVIMFGIINFPNFMMEHYPEVNNKYYLDMQMHLAATNPKLRDLAGIAMWGTHNGDEETTRWGFRLFRHYFLEGQTNMLSKQYGYKYRDSHVQNSDFAEAMTHWLPQPAKGGKIQVVNLHGFGQKVRWTAPLGLGDNFCTMTAAAEPNRISQKLTGLVPGKLYAIRYMSLDVDRAQKSDITAEPLPISVRFDGVSAVELPQLRSVFVHTNKGTRARADFGRINLVRLVFRAKASEAVITFTDRFLDDKGAAPAPGRRLGFNFVQVHPYFEE